MKLKTLVAALVAAAAAPAFATVSPGISQSGANASYSGNGELFLTVFDSVAKTSYTLDLGVTQNAFPAASGSTGLAQSWAVNDANFTSFLSQVSVANLGWAVMALDATGGTAVGGVRLFTTLRNGDEGEFVNLTNQLFTNGTGSAQMGTFFSGINTTGTHGVAGVAPNFAVNGSSVNKDSDSGNGYFGEGSVGLSTNLNGNATFSVANAVGTTSNFYYLGRSGSNQLDTVLVDPFATTFQFASTGSGYVLSASPVPEPESVALLLAGLGVVGMMVRRRRIG